MNTIAGAAITFAKAMQPDFRRYAEQILLNAKALAGVLLGEGVSLVTGGTDNHMIVIDTVKSFGIDGKHAEEILDMVGITTNKQVIPDDPNPPLRPSGIRLGTPACTTRGMVERDMERLGYWIVDVLRRHNDATLIKRIHGEVRDFCDMFPVPGLPAE